MTEYVYISELETDSVREVADLVLLAITHHDALQLGPSGPTLKSVWFHLRRETHDLLCTKSTKYQSERTLIATAGAPAIAALTTYLTSDFGIPVASASALASLALFLPLKMTINAWCQAFSKNAEKPGADELNTLKQLARKSD
jgi:hypothetical protein